jgi:hypothetical protein
MYAPLLTAREVCGLGCLGAFARKPTALAYRVSDFGEMYGIEYYDQKFRLQRIKWLPAPHFLLHIVKRGSAYFAVWDSFAA